MKQARPYTRLLALMFTLLVIVPSVSAQLAMQNDSARAPNMLMRAISLPAGVRYTVTYLKPEGVAYDSLLAEIKLPPGAQVSEVFETAGVAFIGTRQDEDGLTLLWSGDGLGDAPLAPLSFTLETEADSDIQARFRFQAAASGSPESGSPEAETFSLLNKPQPLAAMADTAALTLGAQGTGGALLAVGETGVLIGAAADILPEATEIVVHELPREENPSDPLDPSLDLLWWCSLVSIDGLPSDAAVSVVVPLRRPLAPFTPVALYAENADGTWTPLAEQGIVSADGATVAYVHTGGTIATGVEGDLLPEILTGDQIAPIPAGFTDRIAPSDTPDDIPLPAGEDSLFPVCSRSNDVDAPPVVCALFEGVYRQCLPGYINCTFSSRDFGTCFDPGLLGTDDGLGPLCAFAPSTP